MITRRNQGGKIPRCDDETKAQAIVADVMRSQFNARLYKMGSMEEKKRKGGRIHKVPRIT